jgi:glutaminase
MANFSQDKLKIWATEAKSQAIKGKLPQYIPLLKQADSQGFSLYLANNKTTIFSHGDLTLTFSLMSLTKQSFLLNELINIRVKTV